MRVPGDPPRGLPKSANQFPVDEELQFLSWADVRRPSLQGDVAADHRTGHWEQGSDGG